ncbi:DUF1877 family protein [Kitasatospora sp. NPDC096147]|uniref:DUF1877 family protein n=1 Tax=Kitasatospora sp. NPDC096147 TaxID=3364093 RepID=UPI0037F4FA66
MALTQQLARVSTEYLDGCRRAATAAPDGDPGFDPPPGDALDLGWAAWELAHYLRWAEDGSELLRTLERGLGGDGVAEVAFLDHAEVHDGFGGPPALLAPSAVAELSARLGAVDPEAMLARFPADPVLAEEVCGFGGFDGDRRASLADCFAALRDFYRGAALRGLAVVVWVD